MKTLRSSLLAMLGLSLSLGLFSTAGADAFGDGSDGPLIVSSGTTSLGPPTPLGVAPVSSGATFMPTNFTTGIFAGDEVLIINYFGPNAGNYEFATVASVSTSPVGFNLTAGLTNAYPAGNEIHVCKVMHYSTINIAAGATLAGTVPTLAIRVAGPVSINGTLTMSGNGHIGGQITPNLAGQQGSSHNGFPGISSNNNFGGGGGGEQTVGSASGGGGGSYGDLGTAGTAAGGTFQGLAGLTYGAADLTTMFAGSGGGGGGEAGVSAVPTRGGSGGGILFMAAQSMAIGASGNILCDGGDGEDGNASILTGASAGAGGSGGSIYIQVSALGITGNGTIRAVGGFGGGIIAGGGANVGDGGDGGDGRIRIDGPVGIGISVDPTPFTGSAPLAAETWNLYE